MNFSENITKIKLLIEQMQSTQKIGSSNDSNVGVSNNQLRQSRFRSDIEDNAEKYEINYPRCIRSGNSNVSRVVKSSSGQYSMVVYTTATQGYQFYLNGKVRKPDGKMGTYYCDNRTIIVDGIDIGRVWAEKYNKENPSTEWAKSESEKAIKHSENFIKTISNPHNLLTVASFVTMFIPVVGPFISAGISMGDAYLYKKEGDTKMAGFVGVFACLPVIGAVASKIPAIAKLGSKGMQSLGAKLATNTTKNLTQTEIEVVNGLAKNQSLVTTETNNYFQSLAKQTISSKSNQTASQELKQLAKGGIKMLSQYGSVGYTYHKGYDYIQKDTPKVMVSQENMDWEHVKTSFGSSGSNEDNLLLKNAWNKGWRPGEVVPQEFQTAAYKKNYEEEMTNINNLEKYLSKIK